MTYKKTETQKPYDLRGWDPKTQDLNFEIQTIKKCSKIVLIVNRKINQRLFNSAGKKSATSSI